MRRRNTADPPAVDTDLMGTTITERIHAAPVDLPNVPASEQPQTYAYAPAVDATIEAEATRQYVSSNTNYFGFLQWFQSLPQLIDETEQLVGDTVYLDMGKDPKIRSTAEILVLSALAADAKVLPQVNAKPATADTDGYDRATQMQEFCEANLRNLVTPLSQTLHRMAGLPAGALAMGNKVAEKVWEVADSGPYAGKLLLRELNVKPRRSLAFVVDRFMHVVGLLGLINPSGNFLAIQTLIQDPSQVPNLLPREKFAVLTFLQQDEDPRGVSWLRSVYTAWWRKLQLIGERMKHCTQLAGGMLKGTTAESAKPTVQRDSNGVPILDPATGKPQILYPEQQMASILEAARNGAVLAVPFGSDVEILAVQRGAQSFQDAIEQEDKWISEGITFQSLATSEAQHGTRAQSQVHQDTMQLAINHLRSCMEQMVVQDVFRPAIEYNFGREWLEFTPAFVMTDSPQEDRAKLMAGVAQLEGAGWFTPEQKPAVDVQLGLEPRSQEAVEEEKERRDAMDQMAQQAQDAATGGGGVGGAPGAPLRKPDGTLAGRVPRRKGEDGQGKDNTD